MGVLLATKDSSNVDISTVTEILKNTYTDSDPALIYVRVVVTNVSGNSPYRADVYINNNVLLPEYPIMVNDATTFILQTDAVVIVQNDVVSIRLVGSAADTAAGCTIHIIDTRLYDGDIDSINHIVNAAKTRTVFGPQPSVIGTRVIFGPQSSHIKTFALPTGLCGIDTYIFGPQPSTETRVIFGPQSSHVKTFVFPK